jgi:hypothetical protein
MPVPAVSMEDLGFKDGYGLTDARFEDYMTRVGWREVTLQYADTILRLQGLVSKAVQVRIIADIHWDPGEEAVWHYHLSNRDTCVIFTNPQPWPSPHVRDYLLPRAVALHYLHAHARHPFYLSPDVPVALHPKYLDCHVMGPRAATAQCAGAPYDDGQGGPADLSPILGGVLDLARTFSADHYLRRRGLQPALSAYYQMETLQTLVPPELLFTPHHVCLLLQRFAYASVMGQLPPPVARKVRQRAMTLCGIARLCKPAFRPARRYDHLHHWFAALPPDAFRDPGPAKARIKQLLVASGIQIHENW